MAVYQGARLRTVGVPAAAADTTSRPAARPAIPVAPRVRPAALLVATILVATIFGLVYLTQTLGANASSVEIGKLAADRDRYERSLLTQRSRIGQLTTEGVVEEWASANELIGLGEAVIVQLP